MLGKRGTDMAKRTEVTRKDPKKGVSFLGKDPGLRVGPPERLLKGNQHEQPDAPEERGISCYKFWAMVLGVILVAFLVILALSFFESQTIPDGEGVICSYDGSAHTCFISAPLCWEVPSCSVDAEQAGILVWHNTATEKAVTTTAISIYRGHYPSNCDFVTALGNDTYLCANFADIPTEVTVYCDGDPEKCNDAYGIKTVDRNNANDCEKLLVDEQNDIKMSRCLHACSCLYVTYSVDSVDSCATRCNSLTIVAKEKGFQCDKKEMPETINGVSKDAVIRSILEYCKRNSVNAAEFVECYDSQIDAESECIHSKLVFTGTCQDAINIYGGVCA